MLSLGPLFQTEWEEVDVEHVEVVGTKLLLKANMVKLSCCCNGDLMRAAMVDMIPSRIVQQVEGGGASLQGAAGEALCTTAAAREIAGTTTTTVEGDDCGQPAAA